MASRMAKLLFPSHFVMDDTGRRTRVTGRLPLEQLGLAGFDPYRSDDSFFKKAVYFAFAIVLLIGAIAAMDFISAQGNNLGCWTVPIVILLIFGVFHQMRMWAGRRGDEELLQNSLADYREKHPEQCPACDGTLSEPDLNNLCDCQACGAAWFAITQEQTA